MLNTSQATRINKRVDKARDLFLEAEGLLQEALKIGQSAAEAGMKPGPKAEDALIAIEDALGGLACTDRALWGVRDKLALELAPEPAARNDAPRDGGGKP